MSDDRTATDGRRYRIYQIIGIVLAVLFLGLGVTAFLAGGGPVIAAIAIIGGLAVLIVSIVMMVRS